MVKLGRCDVEVEKKKEATEKAGQYVTRHVNVICSVEREYTAFLSVRENSQ